MDLFEQLQQMDQLVAEEEEKRKQEELFSTKKANSMDFLVEDIVWQEIEMEKAQEAEVKKLKPLSSGFGPWAW